MTRDQIIAFAKPVLFNTEMVQAILNGHKTCTRRLIRPMSRYACGIYVTEGQVFESTEESRMWHEQKPLFKPGDMLYVRETWSELSSGYEYKADGEEIDHLGNEMKWKPSIHMPKDAARIFLRITQVRIERLQDITIEDIRREGLTSMAVFAGDKEIAYQEWEQLWNSTVPKKELEFYGWHANPWVWVYEFERVVAEP